MNLSIIVLAWNEVSSLRQTIEELQEILGSTITDIFISTSKYALPECIATANELAKKYSNVAVYYQEKPFVASAVLEPLSMVRTKYVIYMSSDLETPTNVIPKMLEKVQEFDWDIVVASRWINGGSFESYGTLKQITSWMAQQLCKFVYLSRLTEFTYGFRMYKTHVLSSCSFREQKHPFFLESLLVPLKLKASIVEVPVRWTARVEGSSVVTLGTLLGYLKPIVRVKLTNSRNLTKSTF